MSRVAMPLRQRFEGFIERVTDSGCWIWMGKIERNGYGRMRVGEKSKGAHRVSYEIFNGAIPDGLTVDHLCRVTACVNPDHLEAVTIADNLRRGYGWGGLNAKKIACPLGHKYEGDNLRIKIRRGGQPGRICITCSRLADKRRHARERLLRPPRPARSPMCPRGHNKDILGRVPSNKGCITCARQRSMEYNHRTRGSVSDTLTFEVAE